MSRTRPWLRASWLAAAWLPPLVLIAMPLASAGSDDKLVYLLPVENFQKRSDLWNEDKAAVQ